MLVTSSGAGKVHSCGNQGDTRDTAVIEIKEYIGARTGEKK